MIYVGDSLRDPLQQLQKQKVAISWQCIWELNFNCSSCENFLWKRRGQIFLWNSIVSGKLFLFTEQNVLRDPLQQLQKQKAAISWQCIWDIWKASAVFDNNAWFQGMFGWSCRERQDDSISKKESKHSWGIQLWKILEKEGKFSREIQLSPGKFLLYCAKLL